MIKIKYAEKEDKDFWLKLDRHLSESGFLKKVRDRQGYVIFDNNMPVGLLRYNLFWDSIPFCTLLYIDCKFQKKGYGRKLIEFWEADMKSKGHGMVMTSTQTDENAQHFYRKLGYKDSGGLILNISGYEQPMEMFFVKPI